MEGFTASIACPADTRRSVGVLVLNFCVFTLTTLAFYSLVRRQQGARFSVQAALMFFFAPLNIIFRYLFALVVILGFAGCRHLSSLFSPDADQLDEETSHQVKRALRFLFGNNHDGNNPSESLVAPLSDFLDDNREYLPLRLSRGGRRAALIFTGVFASCYFGAIFLYYRRYQHEAATLLDLHIFHVACGGLFMSILSAIYTFDAPFFKGAVPTETESPLEEFMIYLRDPGPQGYWFLYVLNTLAVSLVVQTLLGPLRPLIKGSSEIFSDYGGWLLIVVVTCFSIAGGVQTAGGRRHHSFVDRLCRQTAFACAYLGCATAAFTLGCGMLIAWAYHVMFFQDAFLEIGELGNPSGTKPCPLLWRDPVARYLGWLA